MIKMCLIVSILILSAKLKFSESQSQRLNFSETQYQNRVQNLSCVALNFETESETKDPESRYTLS